MLFLPLVLEKNFMHKKGRVQWQNIQRHLIFINKHQLNGFPK